MKGPGKYDEQCGRLMRETDAEAVLLIVCNGNRGSGFSMSVLATVRDKAGRLLPGVLREVATEIETDLGPPASGLQ